MALHISSVLRADTKFYRVFPTPNANYEVVECETGRSDRVLCRFMKYEDAVLVAEALNNFGSKQDE